VPPHELKDDDKKLEGFAWRIEERPSRNEILIAPSEILRRQKEVEEMINEEKEENTKLEKLMEEKIDLGKIKEQLKKPAKELQQQ